MEKNEKIFESAFSYKLIYVFRINDSNHEGKLKIGEATVHTLKDKNDLLPNCNELLQAAKDRINSYTSTAGIKYELLYTELAVSNNNTSFRDTDVHEVLLRSGYKKYYFDTERKQNEWFIVNLDVVKYAIAAVKEGRTSLNTNEKNHIPDPVSLRPEQEEAIKKTIAQFSKGNRMLWNAKMRFGKTLSTLEIVKRKQFNKTIILTHRPVVDKSWYDDFGKVFIGTEYLYGSKRKGEHLDKLLESKNPFVYFASIQDLRGSKEVGGKYEKNKLVFNTIWDFVVVDEAHEGTKTEKGITTLEGVIKLDNDYPTKILELSGTAFNLLEDYKEDEIYTWDYIMEQEAKRNWYIHHYGDPNPYEELPELQIYTYDLNKLLPGYEAVYDTAFNFREFFRVWTNNIQKDGRQMPENVKEGQFIHEEDVKKFLNLICRSDEKSNYPYSKESYRDYFRHSLWMVPGVKEAKALSKMLHEHPVFGSGQFNIINIAGSGDEEMEYKDALEAVNNGIGKHPEETYSITISCGKLTTGVTVKPWTAVLMLSGSYSTSASSYLQTIFRVQSPANIGGKIKEKCYVFDFAPDRSLKMVASATKLSIKAGNTQDRIVLGKFLNFCPVIAIDGSKMAPYDVDSMMGQLKKAYAERVVNNGFDDRYIYNDNLFRLDANALQKFKDLERIVGATKPTKKIEKIDINNQGFTQGEYEQLEKIKNKSRKELTEEEKQKLEELKEKKKQSNIAISILRSISIRIPLLIYGSDIKDNEDITIDNLTDLVDDISWEEFMPKGVTKETFKEFAQYYEQDVFVEAGRKIRRVAKYADTLSPTERVKEIASIFSLFRNPDKETVLTPWKTVNMHMGDTIGGYNFFDKIYEKEEYRMVAIEEPRFISYGDVTQNILNNENVKILEINSKSGLYPLYIAYSLYRQKCLDIDSKKLTEELKQTLWNEVIENNIFVLCKTPMAKSITERTLKGYNDINTNIKYDSNLLCNIANETDEYAKKLCSSEYWGKDDKNMHFNAIVGNPPYNIIDGGGGSSSKPIYNKFVEASIKLNPKYMSMIIPSRWFSGGKGLDDFRKLMINDKRIRVLHDYIDSRECFSNVSIEGGVCYFLWENGLEDKCKMFNHTPDKKVKIVERYLSENEEVDIIVRNEISLDILKKVLNKKEESFSKLVYPRNAFKIDNTFENYFTKKETQLRILARIDNCRQYRYLSKNFKLKGGKELIGEYKIFMSKADGAAGQLGNPIPAKIIGRPEFGMPNDICTETFLVIGPLKGKEEMYNVQKYLKTKFCRYMIGIRKNKNMTQDTYKFVPIQDFTSNSDIDWNKNLNEIDNKLFEKYNLTTKEIKNIEEMISSV